MPNPSLIEVSSRLGCDPFLLHALIAAAKNSDSPVADLDQIGAIVTAEQFELYEKLARLEFALQHSWNAETSAYGGGDARGAAWNVRNPAAGQCAVTAVEAQKALGGEIVRVVAQTAEMRDSHYFNILPDGRRVDFTWRQFPADTEFHPALNESNDVLRAATKTYLESKGFSGTTQEYVLSFPATCARYEKLHAGVEAHGMLFKPQLFGLTVSTDMPRAYNPTLSRADLG